MATCLFSKNFEISLKFCIRQSTFCTQPQNFSWGLIWTNRECLSTRVRLTDDVYTILFSTDLAPMESPNINTHRHIKSNSANIFFTGRGYAENRRLFRGGSLKNRCLMIMGGRGCQKFLKILWMPPYGKMTSNQPEMRKCAVWYLNGY